LKYNFTALVKVNLLLENFKTAFTMYLSLYRAVAILSFHGNLLLTKNALNEASSVPDAGEQQQSVWNSCRW